jgi:hypothetical protein
VSQCETCGDGEYLPQYGVAPHDCFYKIGAPVGGSKVHPEDAWPDNFEVDTESNGRCGTYHCPTCGPKFKAGKPIAEGEGK